MITTPAQDRKLATLVLFFPLFYSMYFSIGTSKYNIIYKLKLCTQILDIFSHLLHKCSSFKYIVSHTYINTTASKTKCSLLFTHFIEASHFVSFVISLFIFLYRSSHSSIIWFASAGLGVACCSATRIPVLVM